jgi:hypothetical protein
MMTPDQAYRRLRKGNPAPVRRTDRPSAETFLALARSEPASPVRSSTPLARVRSSGPVLAVAAFVAVLAVGLLAYWLFSFEGDVVDDPPVPTTAVAQTTTSILRSSLVDSANELAAAYSSGDSQAVTALLAPGTAYGWTRVSDFGAGPVLWTADEFEARFAIDTALNTRITLTDCEELAGDRISCAVLRMDDLVRAQSQDPTGDVRWRLTFADGLITEWIEHTPDISVYFMETREPFHQWIDVNHPEIEVPHTDLRGQPWRADSGFELLASDLVAEFAESLGVDLGR